MLRVVAAILCVCVCVCVSTIYNTCGTPVHDIDMVNLVMSVHLMYNRLDQVLMQQVRAQIMTAIVVLNKIFRQV